MNISILRRRIRFSLSAFGGEGRGEVARLLIFPLPSLLLLLPFLPAPLVRPPYSTLDSLLRSTFAFPAVGRAEQTFKNFVTISAFSFSNKRTGFRNNEFDS